jgi:hypothetical protein
VLQPGSAPRRGRLENLNDRLRQNTVQEKLGNAVLDRLLEKEPDIRRV